MIKEKIFTKKGSKNEFKWHQEEENLQSTELSRKQGELAPVRGRLLDAKTSMIAYIIVYFECNLINLLH